MGLTNDIRTAFGYMPAVVACSASFVLIYLNNFVDQFYINMNGEVASQAYTLSIPIYWTIMSLAAAFGTGAAIMVRRHWAYGDDVAANQSACNAILYCAVIGFAVSAVLYVVTITFLLGSIDDTEVFDALDSYITPYFIFFIGIALNSVLCALMAVDGGARMSLVCLAVSLVANAILDPVFVEVLGLGVFGNGLGTAVALTISGLIAVAWFRQGHGKLTISFKYLKPSLSGARKSLKTVWLFLVRTFFGHLAELIIRLNLYLSYALSYGIPMLCASMSYVLCSGSLPALAPRYRQLADEGDTEGAMSLFRGSVLVTFAFMLAFTLAVYVLAGSIADVFTTVPGLTENRDVIIWTLRVLCFTAPFIGLKSVCAPAFSPHSDSIVSTAGSSAWCLVRMVLFLIFLDIGYSEAIWFFLFERMFVGIYYLVATYVYIQKKYCTVS